MAHLHQQRGEPEPATRLFARARDLDTQRFRTDARLNGRIRRWPRRIPPCPWPTSNLNSGWDRTAIIFWITSIFPCPASITHAADSRRPRDLV